MVLRLILMLLFVNPVLSAQTDDQIDSLIQEICISFDKAGKNDKIKHNVYQERISSFIEKHDSNDELLSEIINRLEKNIIYPEGLTNEWHNGTWERITGQTPIQKDSLIDKVCNTLIELRGQNDSTRFNYAYTKHLLPILSKYSFEEQNLLLNAFEIRYSRNCEEYRKMNDEEINHSSVAKNINKPISKLNRSQCKDFFKLKKFYYLNPILDTTKVELNRNIWFEEDRNSFTKLKFRKISDYEYELEFIKSSNVYKKNYSNRGDKFRYLILDKGANFFEIIHINSMEGISSKYKLFF